MWFSCLHIIFILIFFIPSVYFTEWKYHFQETPKASYFRINEASPWEKKARRIDWESTWPHVKLDLGQMSLWQCWFFRALSNITSPQRSHPGELNLTWFRWESSTSVQMCFFAGAATLTHAGHFILEYASHFADKLRGSASPDTLSVCTKLPRSSDKTTYLPQ